MSTSFINHDDTSAALAVLVAETRGLTTFFHHLATESKQTGRAECTVESHRFLKKIAAAASSEMQAIRRGLFGAYGVGLQPELGVIDVAGPVKDKATDLIQRLEAVLAVYSLSELPPGNPGEEEFERIYAERVGMSVPYHRTVETLKRLIQELDSPLYRLDVSDEVREAAWKEEKKRQIMAFIDQCRAEIAQAEDTVRKGRILLKKAADDLKNIDQMPLFPAEKIIPNSDGAEAEQAGPDTAAPSDGGEQKSTKDGSDATGGT